MRPLKPKILPGWHKLDLLPPSRNSEVQPMEVAQRDDQRAMVSVWRPNADEVVRICELREIVFTNFGPPVPMHLTTMDEPASEEPYVPDGRQLVRVVCSDGAHATQSYYVYPVTMRWHEGEWWLMCINHGDKSRELAQIPMKHVKSFEPAPSK